MTLPQTVFGQERYQLCIEVLALLPRERVVYLEANFPTGIIGLLILTSNTEALYPVGAVRLGVIPVANPDGPNAHKKPLRTLHLLYSERCGNGGRFPGSSRLLPDALNFQRSLRFAECDWRRAPYLFGSVEADKVGDIICHLDPDKECPVGYCSD